MNKENSPVSQRQARLKPAIHYNNDTTAHSVNH